MNARAPAPHVALLLRALQEPASVDALDEAGWDLLVRTARAARLLSTLAQLQLSRTARAEPPPRVARQLDSAVVVARHRRKMVAFELDCVATALRGVADVPIVLMKGAAYLLQDLPFAQGRLPDDVDIMVPRERLAAVEEALLAAGWRFEKTDPYDQHFYRAWSHELPPLACPGHALELDVHHTILPPPGRLKPDATALFAASVPLADPRFRVLSPADQVLHAAAHLFQDSDCTRRLRDLVDIHGLCTHHGTAPAFWEQLAEHADRHGMQTPIFYAAQFMRDWLGFGFPARFDAWLARRRGVTAARRIVLAAMRRVLAPVDPRAEMSFGAHLASRALEFRALWLRMPPWLLAWHAANKAVRSLKAKPEDESAVAG